MWALDRYAFHVCACMRARARGAESAEEIEQHRVDGALVGHLCK